MNINILDVLSSDKYGAVVAFDSILGKATAFWSGPAPSKGSEHDVELEVPGVLAWGADVLPAQGPALIYGDSSHVHLVGEVQSTSDDGVIALNLQKAVLLVEVSDLPSQMPPWVVVRASQLSLFDTRL